MSSTDDIDGISPGVTLDVRAIRKGVLTIMTANNITSDAQWSAHIDSRSDAQLLTLLRNFFKTLVKVT